jgi:hypothetical protein
MSPLVNEWLIKHRADACAATHRPFVAGEQFYTLLFREADGFRREDLSVEAWTNQNENIRPFSFWKTRYEPSPLASPEPLPKESAEELLRRLLTEGNTERANAIYVLAVMLERKRVLKQVRSEETEDGRLLIYEHRGTGDVLLVRDPQLRLDQLESVQAEVAQRLQI